MLSHALIPYSDGVTPCGATMPKKELCLSKCAVLWVVRCTDIFYNILKIDKYTKAHPHVVATSNQTLPSEVLFHKV